MIIIRTSIISVGKSTAWYYLCTRQIPINHSYPIANIHRHDGVIRFLPLKQYGMRSSLPIAITSINQFISPPLESTFKWHLSMSQPSLQSCQIYSTAIQLLQYAQSRQTTVSVSTVCFIANIASDTTLIRLTLRNKLCNITA